MEIHDFSPQHHLSCRSKETCGLLELYEHQVRELMRSWSDASAGQSEEAALFWGGGGGSFCEGQIKVHC